MIGAPQNLLLLCSLSGPWNLALCETRKGKKKQKQDWLNFSSSALEPRHHWLFLQSFVLIPHAEHCLLTTITQITAQIVFMFVANRVYLGFSSGISNTACLLFCWIESSFVNPPQKVFLEPIAHLSHVTAAIQFHRRSVWDKHYRGIPWIVFV